MRLKTRTGTLGLFLGIAAFVLVLACLDLDPEHPEITRTFAVAVLMAIWWVTEAIPIAATALLPVALFPILGVMNGKAVSSAYFNHIIFLFIGGFMLALTMEKWRLHKRIALKILMTIGVGPGRLLFGFMLATAFLSMWMSNTATTMMMVPIVFSVVLNLEESVGTTRINQYATGLFLGVAYSASIGGIATLVGTPPNLSFVRIFAIMFPDAPDIAFANWLFFAFPITVLMFAAAWILLFFWYRPKQSWSQLNHATFQAEYDALGKASFEEKAVLIAFIAMALLWVFRSQIDMGHVTLPGWSAWLAHPDFVNDGTVAIGVASVLFCLPAKNHPGTRILDWETARRLPWHIVLLFGGGFALATAFAASGLSMWCGERLAFLGETHPLIIVGAISSLMSLLTELTSNTATTEMILPVIAGLATSIKIHPLLFMIPATLAASLAFMLPVATPPNAIIFGTDRVSIPQMAKTGFFLNLIGVLIVALFTYFLASLFFGIDTSTFPQWALSAG